MEILKELIVIKRHSDQFTLDPTLFINLKERELKELLKCYSDSYNTMMSIQHITDAILKLPVDFIKRYFNVETIPGTTTLFSVGIRKANDIYLLQEITYSSDGIHSIFVSTVCCNLMRNYIPNFLFLLGHMRTTPIYVDKSRNVTSWILERANEADVDTKLCSTYKLFYEYMENSSSFATFCESCNTQEFLECYMQILYSLREAKNKCGFIHGNLIAESVFVKALNERSTIRYGDTYLTTKNVAIMFNFAKSTVTRKDKIYTPHPNSYQRRTMQKNREDRSEDTVHDAYKLFENSLNIMKNSDNNATRENLTFMFRFFRAGDTKLSSETEIFGDLDDLIRFIHINNKLGFISDTQSRNEPLVISRHGEEISLDEAVSLVAGNKLLLHDIHEYLYLQDHSSNIGKFITENRSYFPGLLENELKEYNYIRSESQKQLKVNVVELPPRKLTLDEKRIYRIYVSTVMGKVEMLKRMIEAFDASFRGAKEIGDLTMQRNLNVTKSSIENFRNAVRLYVDSILLNKAHFVKQGEKSLSQYICSGALQKFK